MFDQLASGFLLFSDDIIIVPLIVLGLICLDRSVFYHAACLIFFSILLNVALKNSFQVPLSPLLGKKGYAFPSGHMQLVTVLYGWLALKFNKKGLYLGTLLLLAGIGASLIHFGYHTIYDVIAGLFVGLILLLVYEMALTKWPKKMPWCLLLIASIFLLYIDLRTFAIAEYVWKAYLGLWLVIIIMKCLTRKRS